MRDAIKATDPIKQVESTNASPSSRFAFETAFVAAIGGFLFGFDLGMIGAANVYLRDQFQLSDAQFGFATASAVLGCILGPGLGAWLCDAIGRKRTMLAASILLALSAIVTAVPDMLGSGSAESTMLVFNVFRFVGGMGVGLCSVASPMYIAEIAPARKRGAMGLMYQLAIVVGHAVAPLIAFVIVYILRVCYNVTEAALPDTAWLQAWRWMFFSETLCVVLFVAFVVRLPFSPRWLAEKDRFDEAEAVLARVDGPDYARLEMAEIRSSLDAERGNWSQVFAPGMRFALLAGILLTFFNNWTGWSVIGGYIPRLLELAGFNRESAIGNFVAVYVAMGLMTVVSLLLMDRLGRRPLWIVASLMMAAITCATGFLFYYEVTGWPILVILGLVTVPHGIALGGIPWLMMSEMFPTRLRAKAVALTTTVLWIFIFSGVYLFPIITGFSQQHLLTARKVTLTTNTISFHDANPDYLQQTGGDFDESGFRPGNQVTLIGASVPENNGTYTIASVGPERLTLKRSAHLVNEPSGAEVTVQVGSVAPAFWLFTGICMLSVLFGLTIMPETKDRTLEEIGASWQKHEPQTNPTP